MNTSTKLVYVTRLHDAAYKYSGGISKKVVPNLSIDEEILFLGNGMVLSAVIYHEGEQSYCGLYTSWIKVVNTGFFISDARILSQWKLQCSSKDIGVPYILIYERITNFWTAPLISLNGTVETGPTLEQVTETVEIMIRQSVV